MPKKVKAEKYAPMTVGKLVELLKKQPQDATVLVASDEEGNDFHEVYSVQDSVELTGVVIWPC